MRKDLLHIRDKVEDKKAGDVIAELAFKFWVNLFTARFDRRLWNKHLQSTFPNLPASLPLTLARQTIHQDLDQIRKLRNRIAHHEPIFLRDIHEDHTRVNRLIAWRCRYTAGWVNSLEAFSTILPFKP